MRQVDPDTMLGVHEILHKNGWVEEWKEPTVEICCAGCLSNMLHIIGVAEITTGSDKRLGVQLVAYCESCPEHTVIEITNERGVTRMRAWSRGDLDPQPQLAAEASR